MGSRTGFGDARERAKAPAPKKGFVRDTVETVLVCFVAVLFLRAFVFQQSEIPSASMEDTILVGDYVLVNRFLYAPTSFGWERGILPVRDPRRGDVVVFRHPRAPEQDYIKRVIGLPGETVALDDGRLVIDGRPLDEPWLREGHPAEGDFGPVTVASGHYFLLGDNRPLSSDSRDWGQVPEHLLKGRAVMVLLSTSAEPAPGAARGQVTLRSLGQRLIDLVVRARPSRFFRPVR